MHFDYKGIGHPTQSQLVDFAESLVDRQASVSAVLAAHVAGCPKCAHEIQRMRASLELADLSSQPDPSAALTREIVFRARAELNKRSNPPRPGFLALRAVQYAVCAAAAVVLAVYSFSAALNDAAQAGSSPPEKTMLVSEQSVDANALLRRAETVKALSASLSLRQKSQESPRETEYRRALEMLDHDLNAARAALQRNPGNTRANQVMVMSLERQLEDLRDLYLDRTF